MRFSRPCYDKPHRCPGWAGGGMKYAKWTRCDNGSIHTTYKRNSHPGAHPFRFGHCNKCGVITWPWFTRRLDPTYWWYEIRMFLRRVR